MSQALQNIQHLDLVVANTASHQPFIDMLEAWYAQAIFDAKEVRDLGKAMLIAKHEILQRFSRNKFPGVLLDVIRHVNCYHVGEIWVWPMNDSDMRLGFIHVNPQVRRNGHGRNSVLKAEEYAASQGYKNMRLNVFKHMQHVYHLYLSLGYRVLHETTLPNSDRVTRIEMQKSI